MKLSPFQIFMLKFELMLSKKEQKQYWKLSNLDRYNVRLMVAYAPELHKL